MSNNGNGKAVTKAQIKDASAAIEAAHASLGDDLAFGYRLNGPTPAQREHGARVDAILAGIFSKKEG